MSNGPALHTSVTDFVHRLISLCAAISLVFSGPAASAAPSCSELVTGEKKVAFSIEPDPIFDSLDSHWNFSRARGRMLVMSANTVNVFESTRETLKDRREIRLAEMLSGGWSVEFVYKSDLRKTPKHPEPIFKLKETILVDPDGNQIRAPKNSDPFASEMEISIPKDDAPVIGQIVRRPVEISGKLLDAYLEWCERIQFLEIKDIHSIRKADTKLGYLSLYLRYQKRKKVDVFFKKTDLGRVAAQGFLYLSMFVVVSTLWKEPVSYQFPWSEPKYEPMSAAVSNGLQTPYVVMKSAVEKLEPVAFGKEGHIELVERHTQLEDSHPKSKITVLSGVDSGKGKSTSFFTGVVFGESGVIVVTHFNHEAEKTKSYVIERASDPQTFNILVQMSGHLSMQQGQ